MSSRYFALVVGVCLLVGTQPSYASLTYFYNIIFDGGVGGFVEGPATGISTLVDEIDRVDVTGLLYVTLAGSDTELDYKEKTCLRQGTETLVCSVRTFDSPTTQNCKYCNAPTFMTYRNQESNPNNPPDWELIESYTDPNTVVDPACGKPPSGPPN